MMVPAIAVGRLGPDGPWIGFVPTLDDGYALVVGDATGSDQGQARPADLVALALVYFEESMAEPPDELAATHGDIAAIVRHAADRVDHDGGDGPYRDAVDAIDDGLAPEVVIDRLATAFGDGDPLDHLRRRADQLTARG